MTRRATARRDVARPRRDGTARFGTGLVVGKFSPLHRGHQHLLDAAQADCDRLVVLSWSQPEFAGCDADRRDRWLTTLYPHATVVVLDPARLAALCDARGVAPRRLPAHDEPDDVQRELVAWLLRDVLSTTVDAVFSSEAYGEGFAAHLDAAQRARGGAGVVHVAVDPTRQAVPVSGTAVRADVHAARGWLDPRVYRDFVGRIAVLGGESTGKSVLAERLAERLGTVHAAEYGRELWLARDGTLTPDDLTAIVARQTRREDALALEANRVVVCDTTPLTTLLYAQALFGLAPPTLVDAARRRYDVVLLCAPDVPFVQDGTRRDAGFRQWQHDWYVRELTARGVPFHVLAGDWDARLDAAVAAASTFR